MIKLSLLKKYSDTFLTHGKGINMFMAFTWLVPMGFMAYQPL